MEIITSHISADFDSLASMVAAKKIYPNAKLVFSGAIEKNVKKFVSIYGEIIQITPLKDIKLQDIERLIIVDTRIKGRIGNFARILNKRDLDIHIFDHHPSTHDDIKGNINVIEEVGATTTILLKKIRKLNLEITPIEATLFALGIYEDTGSLTFTTTTIEDVDCISHLFEKGIKLKVVSSFMNIGLSLNQKKLLNQLLLSSREIFCKGIRLDIAKAEVKNYTEGLALLTHKLVDIENCDVFFSLVKMSDRIYIVGRSRTNLVDVDEVLKELGGGGHFQAASAVVKDLSLEELEEKILKVLEEKIKVGITARDIMSSPVKTVSTTTTIEEVEKILLRYGHMGIPVVEEGNLKGIITMKEVNRATRHGFGKEPVSKFMTNQVISVEMNTPLNEIQELMISHDIGRILVVDSLNRLSGIVTRTDIIRNLYGEHISLKGSFATYIESKSKMEREKIINLIKRVFPYRIQEVLKKIGEIGDQLNFPVFMVGGVVRDLLLEIPNLDIDIVVEKYGIKFAQHLVKELGGKVRIHEKFNTAVVILPDNLKLDIATARLEFYEYPAAFPQVELSSIKRDLYRRDFSINAMAIQLNSQNYGKLIDFFGGQRDLKSGNIRVLYNLSFVEDPARILRAIRFEQRYNFKIDKSTEDFLIKAINDKLLTRLRRKRLSEELLLILKEQNPVKAIVRMNNLGVLSYIFPEVKLADSVIEKLEKIKENHNLWKKNVSDLELELWIVYLYFIIEQLGLKKIQRLISKLMLKPKILEKITDIYSNLESVINFLSTPEELLPSAIYIRLKDITNELLFIAILKSESSILKERIFKFLQIYKKERLLISGRDLKRLGIKPGPIYSKILNNLIQDRLNNKVITKKDEIKMALKYLKEEEV